MQSSIHRQRGASMTGIFVGLVIVGFIAMMGIKLVPHYLTFMTVKSFMDDLQQDHALVNKGARAIASAIGKKLDINDIRTLNERDFKVERTRVGYDVSIDYEIREPLFANLDALLTFSHQVELTKE